MSNSKNTSGVEAIATIFSLIFGIFFFFFLLNITSCKSENERLADKYKLKENIVITCKKLFDKETNAELALEILSKERYFFNLLGPDCNYLYAEAKDSGKKELYLRERLTESLIKELGESPRDWNTSGYEKQMDIIYAFIKAKEEETGVYKFLLSDEIRDCTNNKLKKYEEKTRYINIISDCFDSTERKDKDVNEFVKESDPDEIVCKFPTPWGNYDPSAYCKTRRFWKSHPIPGL